MINIAFITDENFVLPTSVAIASLIFNNAEKAITIHLITPGISDEAKSKLLSMQTKNAHINILEIENEFENVSTKGLFNNIPANHTALVKFNLPHILKDIDKVLYLDGDLIVNNDISSLYELDLKDNLVFAVKDKIADWHMEKLGVKEYFNSGVMLLNLKKMREEHYTDKLIKYRNEGFNCFMDQDAFNAVLGVKAKFLPCKYNLMYSVIESRTPKEVQEIYGAKAEKSYSALINEAVVFHFSSNKKPWKYMLPGICALYRKYLDLTPYKGTKFNYQGAEKNICGEEPLKGVDFTDDKIGVSIVVPTCNKQEYLKECLDSLVKQTLKNIEIIVVDDASTDETVKIIKEYAKRDARIRLILNKENKGTCYARKIGALSAKGRYVMFCDSDDRLELCACEKLYNAMRLCDVDMIQFKTKIINQNASAQSVNSFNDYINKDYGFWEQKEILNNIFAKKQLSRNLWNRIYTRELMQESFRLIDDGYYLKSEDMYTTLIICYFARNLYFVKESYYNYRINSGITATNQEIGLDKFVKICTGIDVIFPIIEFLLKNNSEESEIILKNIFQHCFAETNWWIEFVSKENREKCLDIAFEKYNGFLKYIDNVTVATAIAKSLDEMFFSAKSKHIILKPRITSFMEKVTANSDIFDKESNIYHCYMMNNLNAINLFVNINNNDLPYLSVLLESLKRNKEEGAIYNISIFGNKLYNKYLDKIKSYSRKDFYVRIFNNCLEVSNMIKKGISGDLAYKIFATFRLSFLNKLLFISYDCVAVKGIKELFDKDIGDSTFACVGEYSLNDGKKTGKFATNVMLINTEKFIKLNLLDIYLNLKSKLNEREFFNMVLKNDFELLEDKWCFQWHIPYDYLHGQICEDFNIIHYGSNDKPWLSPNHAYADTFWKYARTTSFYEEIIYNNLNNKNNNVKETASFGKPAVKQVSAPVTKKSSYIKKFIKSIKAVGLKKTMKKVCKYIKKRKNKK